MKTRNIPKILTIAAFAALAMPVTAGEPVDFNLQISEDVLNEVEAELKAMGPDDHFRFHFNPGSNGESRILVGQGFGTSIAGITLSSSQRVDFLAGPQADADGITFDGSQAAKRLGILLDSSSFYLEGINLESFISDEDGAVLKCSDEAFINALRTRFTNNFSNTNGGAISATGHCHVEVTDSRFNLNGAGQYGGSMTIEDQATAEIRTSVFTNGTAGQFGCDINLLSTGLRTYESTITLDGSQFSGPCTRASLESPFSRSFAHGSSWYFNDEAIHSTFSHRQYNSYAGVDNGWAPTAADLGGGAKPEALCEDFGTDSFESLGYNFSEDNSCGLDQETDISNTEANTVPDENGIFIPQPGSPLIDSGPTDALVFPGETLESLPCGYKDLRGYGRPQDANNDGVFECDRGATEVLGSGSITPGHSAAFYNLARDGEGQYVEMINADLAVVYTFTHRPDASGSAWFIGVGRVVENSIVIDDLLRPTGTSFGDGFDATQIENHDVGGQSMVFNDCEAGGQGGNVAFSGSREFGYEALITRAQRLSDILGCGAITPHPNAGLSGSYFLPSRNGEGIVVQWLPNGQVLVIFFTYDLNGNQQWVLGIGASDGFSVTMDAVYASSNSSWGSDYDPQEVVLTPWGTFELTWTGCGGVQFTYNSTVPGYGGATRQYSRLTSLWAASCPEFSG